ncbi:MAG: hypothetical protein E7201_06820 [Selenomonas ruminantium]|uniref:Uncharacterized protein n=1 Tax=Selenomonas ruminantium TaxID=971 RepID=A0A927WPK7_SELRU|nr:hypothetical protein [Selenomonas ruminantium]
MHIDYAELEQRVVKKLEKAQNTSTQNEDMAKIYDILEKEIVYVAVHVLAEYDKMNKELHS